MDCFSLEWFSSIMLQHKGFVYYWVEFCTKG